MAHFTEKLMQNGISTRESLGEKRLPCSAHGEYLSAGNRYMGRREIWTTCPACEDQRLANERQAEANAKAEVQQRRIEAMIEESAIPARFIGRTFDNFNAVTPEQKAALNLAREFANNFEKNLKNGTGLILSGLPGTGKSHLAGAILQHILPQYAGLYVTCMGVIRAIRGTWRKDSEKSESQILSMLCDVPLLVIDEIGVQYGTDGEQTILFDVLDRRYREMMPTILLTNQNRDGFKSCVGDRSFDRLTQSCKWVQFDWASYRTTARKLETA